MGRERVFREKKNPHYFRQAFWYGKGVRLKNSKSAHCRILRKRFVRSNGRKTTFEWPKVVSEVNFPTFWGVHWGGLFSGIFRFGEVVFRPLLRTKHAFTRKGLSEIF